MERPLTLEQASMKYGRETKRVRIRRRRRESEIPIDVVEEILMKLPVATLGRCKVVSKEWRSLIRSRDFEGRYMANQKTKDPKLLFVFDDFANLAHQVLDFKSMALEATSASLEEGQSLVYENFKGYLEISESCDGLVCVYGLTKAVEVVNPITTTFKALPLANIQRAFIKYPEPELKDDPNHVPSPVMAFTRFGFGKDILTGQYKLVWLYNDYPPTTSCLLIKKRVRCEVLDLKKRKWRFVSTAPLDYRHHILYNQRPAFANGSFYWLTGDEEGDPITNTKLIVFDIHTEMFKVTSTPPFITRDASGDKISVCNLNGRLCVSELKVDCKQEFWWMANNNTWEKIFTVDLCSTSIWFSGITSQPLTPLAISKENKVILSLYSQENLVAFDLDSDSPVYHLYHLGYYGLAVPYFPSLILERLEDFSR